MVLSKPVECDIAALEGKSLDPYSKSGKGDLKNANCEVSQIYGPEGTTFVVGDPFSMGVLLSRGYFTLLRQFDEAKGDWRNAFSPVTAFDSERILLTGGGGPKQNGLLISPDKGVRIAQALNKIKILKEG